MCMQKLGEPHYCGRKHQTTGDLKRSSSPSALSSCFQLTPICLLPHLSCLSLVRLDKSLGKTVLCETCVVLEVKWAQKVLCSAGALWRIIINSAHNNTRLWRQMLVPVHTHKHWQRAFGEGEGGLQGGLEGGRSLEVEVHGARPCPRDGEEESWGRDERK